MYDEKIMYVIYQDNRIRIRHDLSREEEYDFDEESIHLLP
jgi:hypothetical protein